MLSGIQDRIIGTVSRGGWALADQSVVSLGTFGLNLILARHLPVAEYGVFALIYGVMLAINFVHTSLIVYPMSLKGATKAPLELRRYCASSLGLTLLLFAPLGVAVFLSGIVLHHALAGLLGALALGATELQETLRRTLLAQLRHRSAVPGDMLSYLGQAVAMLVATELGHGTLAVAFLCIGATSVVAAMVQLAQIRPVWQGLDGIALHNWSVGRWMVGNELLIAASTQILPWVLVVYGGTAQAGMFAALLNVVKITHPVLFSISALLVPVTAKAVADKGMAHAKRTGAGFGVLAGVLVIPYFVLLALWPKQVMQLFYGSHSAYSNLPNELRLLVFAYLFYAAGHIVWGLLLGLERSRQALYGQALSTALVLLAGMPLCARYGALGACLAIAVIYPVRTLILGTILFRVQETPLPTPELQVVHGDAQI